MTEDDRHEIARAIAAHIYPLWAALFSAGLADENSIKQSMRDIAESEKPFDPIVRKVAEIFANAPDDTKPNFQVIDGGRGREE